MTYPPRSGLEWASLALVVASALVLVAIFGALLWDYLKADTPQRLVERTMSDADLERVAIRAAFELECG